MFDYKSSDIKGICPKDLFENEFLDFRTLVSLKTGELSPCNDKSDQSDRKSAIFNHCIFIIKNDKHINFKGSLHKYSNNGTNHNDFHFRDLTTVVQDLYEKFNINPYLDLIHNIEFGVNIILPFDTKTFLNSIISFKGKEYELRRFKEKGNLVKFSFDHYEIKIYDKGQQYGLPENILRFEISVNKMQFLKAKKINIKTSVDLLNPDIHKQLGSLLLDYFKQLVVYDSSISLKNLKPHEERILINGQNPKYWSELKNANPETFKKKLPRFRELVNKHGKENLQETVCNLISVKWDWDQLTRIDLHQYQDLQNYLSKIKPKTFPEITNSTFPEITGTTKSDIPQNNPSNSMLFPGTLIADVKRFCRSCGRDITNQKKESVFCSEKLYGATAKKCRNKESNPRNNFKTREQKIKSKGLLFEIDSYLIIHTNH